MTAATLPLPQPDSTANDPTVNFSHAHFAFRQLETWLTSAETADASEAQVEEELALRGRELLRSLLQAHLQQRGTGDVGPALRVFSGSDEPDAAAQTGSKTPPVEAGSGTPPVPTSPPPPVTEVRHSEKRLHECTLHTRFGEVTVERTGYAAAGQTSVHPLDEQLHLPRRSFSYPLQERLVRFSVQGPFAEAVDNVQRDSGVQLSKRTAEQIVQEAAADFAAFYHKQQQPTPSASGSIVVTGIDCKGVPMIKPEQTLRKPRRGKGDKKHKKRMATVATVRTQQRRVRTAEEVVESLFRSEPKAKQPRVRRKAPAAEEHKRVWASLLSSKDQVIDSVVQEVKRVDPDKSKTHVALCDGERALQQRILPALQGVVSKVTLVLDLLHAVEKLWKVAHCFHAEGSAEATVWVRQMTLLLLQGKSRQVVKAMRRKATLEGLQAGKRETVDKVAAYLRRNQEYMRYDEYLAEGLPIASGCVEGACKNLIKDRMERSGMRWSLHGAEAMIQLRSLYLSGDLDDYWDFHLQQEDKRLYPQGRWEVVEK
jgi:hypothetical protein